MNTSDETYNCLASLALFREIYDSENDIYGVLSEFLTDILYSENKIKFSLTEITVLLNRTYDFAVPDAVVSTALKRVKGIKKEKSMKI